MALLPDDRNLALFCDFENIALGVRDAKYRKFNIQHVLERLLVKGSIVVKKAYCDWDRYKEFKAPMHEASFEMIEIPHVRMSGKNSADIRMVVDALDLCYTKSHVDTFVVISGDSDFSPLVSKLRENAKTVIGVGVKNSTSDLLINNCDEFIYYDDLVRELERQRTGPRGEGSSGRGRGGRKRSGRSGRGRGGDEAGEAPVSTAAPERAAAGAPVPAKGERDRDDESGDDGRGRSPRGGRGGRGRRPERDGSEAPAAAPRVDAALDDGPAEAPAPAARREATPAPVVPAEPARSRHRASADVTSEDYHDVGVGDDDDEPFEFDAGASIGVGDAAEAGAGTGGARRADARDADDDPEEDDLDGDDDDGDDADDVGDDEEDAAGDGEDERRQEGIDLVYRTAAALSAERGGKDKLWGSMIKQTLKRRRPGFNESYYGFDSFSKMLEEAEAQELVTLEADERSGGYVILDIAE